MGVEVEVVRSRDDLHDVADDGVVAQHAAEDAALGFAALRRQAIGSGDIGRHGDVLSSESDAA